MYSSRRFDSDRQAVPDRSRAGRLLLLAGTQEARHVSIALSRELVNMTVSLARPERNPRSYGRPLRIGGWGGESSFREWLINERITAVVDATHPFAEQMSHRVARVCSDLDIETVRFLRPSWMPTEQDNWTFLNDASEAAEHIPQDATVFLSTGRRDLRVFENLKGRKIICRIRETPPGPFPFVGGEFVSTPGPFTVESEIRFLMREGVDWLVTRNSGGQGSWPKLEAARSLGLPVAMIRRPPQPDVMKINTVAEILSWVRRRM